MQPSRSWVEAEVKRLGYAWFERGKFNLNIVGLRRQPGTPNTFDDYVTVTYKADSTLRFVAYPATTDPGAYWLQNPMRVDGTAILQPGQYRSCWTLGQHKGQYPALVQRSPSPFKVWRDRNADGTPDYTGATYDDVAGLNLHRAGTASTVVDKWSAGCQVIAAQAHFDTFMSVVHEAATRWGPTFSYTLLDWPAGA